MTDDKGAGEGTYQHINYPIAGGGKKCKLSCPACAYAAGRKAERERCARIADDEAIEHMDGDESYMCGAVEEIAKRIRGGQDGK